MMMALIKARSSLLNKTAAAMFRPLLFRLFSTPTDSNGFTKQALEIMNVPPYQITLYLHLQKLNAELNSLD
jgi:hypothetical protein